MECTTMFKISGDVNIRSTRTTQQRESSTLVRVNLNIHETPDYTQELYIWSVNVTWIYTVVYVWFHS